MANQKTHTKEIKKGLYLIPTPIGNLGDITFRAVEILKYSDCILCEDTRISKNLLDKFAIKSRLIPNHKFNEKKNLPYIIDLLKKNQLISLVSDAGTPGISDPGAILVKECIKESINVFPLPGPSSVTSAVSISGFSEKYFFYGFFPDKEKNLKEDLNILSDLDTSIVFFISPKKINKIIPSIKKNFNDRSILICREMSKFYEEYIRCKVNELKLFDKDPKGEITIVISQKENTKKRHSFLKESDKRNINKMINKLSIKEITDLICQNSKVSKKEIYNYCLKLKNEE
jgi:16S rRNA (cytidine1402-2'-O)-methyltransferase